MADRGELKLVVLTPAKRVLETSCESVYFPGIDGEIGILSGHATLVCQVGVGVLHYDRENMTSFMTVMGGVAEVRDDVVTLLVDIAEVASEIDIQRAEKALERSLQHLGGKGGESVDMDAIMLAADRARARIQAAKRQAELRR